jgi:hypothetical protein
VPEFAYTQDPGPEKAVLCQETQVSTGRNRPYRAAREVDVAKHLRQRIGSMLAHRYVRLQPDCDNWVSDGVLIR